MLRLCGVVVCSMRKIMNCFFWLIFASRGVGWFAKSNNDGNTAVSLLCIDLFDQLIQNISVMIFVSMKERGFFSRYL